MLRTVTVVQKKTLDLREFLKPEPAICKKERLSRLIRERRDHRIQRHVIRMLPPSVRNSDARIYVTKASSPHVIIVENCPTSGLPAIRRYNNIYPDLIGLVYSEPIAVEIDATTETDKDC